MGCKLSKQIDSDCNNTQNYYNLTSTNDEQNLYEIQDPLICKNMVSIKKLYYPEEICDTTQIKSVSVNNYEIDVEIQGTRRNGICVLKEQQPQNKKVRFTQEVLVKERKKQFKIDLINQKK